MKLFIGNYNYSSWSLRAWVLMRHYGLRFATERVHLGVDDLNAQLLKISPAGRVPVLLDSNALIWDSNAICEYINEQYLNGKALPQDPLLRAQIRSRVAEIHSGFADLRAGLPMNCRAHRKIDLTPAIEEQIRRIDRIWSEDLVSGEWLSGDFGILDAFSAPIASRFATYDIQLSAQAKDYQQRLLASPAMRAWYAEALNESEIVEEDEAGVPVE